MVHSAYIHIPFCSYKCDFCDFTAFAGLDSLAEEYCRVVCREIEERLQRPEQTLQLTSVFYGGGTPGLIDPDLIAGIQGTLAERAGLSPDCEVTLETTPHAISLAKAGRWLELGINRLSVGVQSLNDRELQAIGRDHTRQQALEGLKLARAAGFEDVSCDLMYGLPGQTLASWEATLAEILSLALPHLSAYALTLAANSPLLNRHADHRLNFPNDDAVSDMYERLVEMCEQAGLSQYEISNFSYPGYQSQHNFSYWLNQEYLAFGVGAHRYVNGVRSANWRSLRRYMSDWLGSELSEQIDPATRRREAILLGLRTRQGIDFADFKRAYGLDLKQEYEDKLSLLADQGLLELTGERMALSRKGMLVSNLVIAELI